MARDIHLKDLSNNDSIMNPPVSVHIEHSRVEWSEEEEKRVVWKIDMAVMPLLVLGFFILQIDRSNIGNALTDFFFEEVGISQYEFNVGNQLMYLGVVLFEIPSNLVLYRVGPALWIGCQIFAWGLVATFQAFIKGKGVGPYWATRILLGACESGYIPAGLFTITRFYTRAEISKRFAWFYLGNMIASGASGLLAYAILHMRGVADLSGWQWLFLIEGMVTVVIAIAFVALFPQATDHPTSLLGITYFNGRESFILTNRILRDDATKFQTKTHVSRNELNSALTNWKIIGHILITLCCLSSQTSLFAYGPSIVQSYNFGRLESNAMVSIGYWILLVTTILWGWIADKWGRRGPMVLIGIVIGWILVIVNRIIIDTDKTNAKFALVTLIIAFSFNWHPVNGSWMSLNAKSSGERSITMAIFAMSANASGIISSQIFQASDAPKYKTAWTVILALSCTGLVSCVLTNIQYWLLNRRAAKKGEGSLIYQI